VVVTPKPLAISDDLRLREVATRSLRLSDRDVSELTERLLLDPQDVVARIRLLEHFNRLWYSSDLQPSELAGARSGHMLWFVENIPDSKFCGERPCYLESDDRNYGALKEAWLRQLATSESLMRRVNAFMFFSNGQEPQLEQLFRELFREHGDSLWVQALHTLLEPSTGWVDKIVKAVLQEPQPSSSEVSRLTKLADDRQLLRTIGEGMHASASEFKEAIKRLDNDPYDFRSRAQALGYTFSYHGSSSLLGFDPELTMVRFDQMCWVVRHVPGSKFASDALAVSPFTHVYGRDPCLDRLNEGLANLWSTLLTAYSDNKQLMSNAANFCCRAYSESADQEALASLVNNTNHARKLPPQDQVLAQLTSTILGESKLEGIKAITEKLRSTQAGKQILVRAARRFRCLKLP
jgi:hypothetical protein